MEERSLPGANARYSSAASGGEGGRGAEGEGSCGERASLLSCQPGEAAPRAENRLAGLWREHQEGLIAERSTWDSPEQSTPFLLTTPLTSPLTESHSARCMPRGPYAGVPPWVCGPGGVW